MTKKKTSEIIPPIEVANALGFRDRCLGIDAEGRHETVYRFGRGKRAKPLEPASNVVALRTA